MLRLRQSLPGRRAGGNFRLLLFSGILAGGAVLATLSIAFSAAPANFEPDGTVTGSNLNGWHTIGPATWKANAGEITGSGKGWLVFDKSYQDIQVEASWRCTGECQPGLLFRAERTPDGGMKGIYVSLTAGDLASYRITLDAQGNETSRVRLRPNPGDTTVRVAERDRSIFPFQTPLDSSAIVPQAAGPGRGGAGRGRGGAGGRGNEPPNVPKPNDWNVAEVLLDTNMLRPQLNYSSGIAGGIAEEEYGRYGPFALHIGGGEVKFRNIAYKNIQPRRLPDEIVSPKFRMQRINDYYYSWGPAVADFNRDNIPDVVAGPYVYLGPDYRVSNEIWPAQTLNPSTQYFNGLQYAYDFTGDGWPDVINVIFTRRIRLFVNPGTEHRRWDAYDVTDNMTGEQGTLRDIDGDGRLDLVFKDSEGLLVWVSPDLKNPTGAWVKHPISGSGTWPQHGIGAGDVNGDGRPDVIDAVGWWENPGSAKLSAAWPYHPETFGRGPRAGGADIGVYDINGDGLNDIMTSLQAHGWGLAWYEQKKTSDGVISFVEHMVMNNFSTREANAGGVTFSELHGSNIADIDGDGIPDFVTGKREWSHLDSYLDPDAYGTPVLYVYRAVRDKAAPGGARFVPELVHNRSGIGSHVALVDLNGDKKPEIITSTRRGTYIFWNNWKK